MSTWPSEASVKNSKADWPMPMNAAPKTLPKIDPTPPTTTVMNALTM